MPKPFRAEQDNNDRLLETSLTACVTTLHDEETINPTEMLHATELLPPKCKEKTKDNHVEVMEDLSSPILNPAEKATELQAPQQQQREGNTKVNETCEMVDCVPPLCIKPVVNVSSSRSYTSSRRSNNSRRSSRYNQQYSSYQQPTTTTPPCVLNHAPCAGLKSFNSIVSRWFGPRAAATTDQSDDNSSISTVRSVRTTASGASRSSATLGLLRYNNRF
mmetsp:Transcript_15183/g.22590  ORF Transcript_15183/g.22590 Transcript_15183/m.22590 type:complete len:219 (-) Transcript_15183:246-902(-)